MHAGAERFVLRVPAAAEGKMFYRRTFIPSHDAARFIDALTALRDASRATIEAIARLPAPRAIQTDDNKSKITKRARLGC